MTGGGSGGSGRCLRRVAPDVEHEDDRDHEVADCGHVRKRERDDGRDVPWSEIADGSHDDWIRSRAVAFRRFSAPVYLTFHHEPEDDLDAFGTPQEYADAFRRIVSIFDEEDVTNVAFVWTMMSWTFDSDSGRDLMGYYPGNEYVDLIGVDGYNWHGVRPDEPWRSFAEILRPARAFARSHHKPWIVAEYGVVEDPTDPGRKAHWFRAAARAAQRWSDLAGLIYFNVVKDGANWMSESSPSSLRAFRHVGHREYFNP